MSREIQLPKPPKLSLKKIMELRAELHHPIISQFQNKRLTDDDFTEFVCTLNDKLRVPYKALFNSVQHLAGILITPEVSSELSWRLAGNKHQLKEGIVVPYYTRQLSAEWVAAQIWDAERFVKEQIVEDGKGGHKRLDNKVVLNLFVMAGSMAGRYLSKSYTVKTFHHPEVKTMLGFSAYDKSLYDRYYIGDNNFPFRDPRQLVKLRLFVYLDPINDKVGEMTKEYKGLACSSSMKKWNRELMKKRERREFVCPKNYDIAITPCHVCEAGYDQCRISCHSVTYVKQICPRCKEEANFRQDGSQYCIDCLARLV